LESNIPLNFVKRIAVFRDRTVSNHIVNVIIARYNLRNIGGINMERDDEGRMKVVAFDPFKTLQV
jgi:hypothetical protein